jgi:predicted DNA-binding transcriptional regulator AlpA
MSESTWNDPVFAEDFAKIRGTSVDAVYVAHSRGQLPVASKVGRRLAWRRSDVEKWFADQAAQPLHPRTER